MKVHISQEAIEKTAEMQMETLRQMQGDISSCGICGGSEGKGAEMNIGDIILPNREAINTYALHRIRDGGEYSIYDGHWVHLSREDMQLIANEALLAKPSRDARDIQKSRTVKPSGAIGTNEHKPSSTIDFEEGGHKGE